MNYIKTFTAIQHFISQRLWVFIIYPLLSISLTSPLLLTSSLLGHCECLKLLIENIGIDVNLKDKFGFTSLARCSMKGHHLCVSVLIEHGADVNIMNITNGTALHEAARLGHFLCCSLLIANGALINVQALDQSTPLHLATENGHVECMSLLIDDTDVNVKDNRGNTVLHKACMNKGRSIECLKLVLTKDIDINCKNKSGYSGIAIAVKTENDQLLSVLDLFLNRGFDINNKDDSDLTVLHEAVDRGLVDFCSKLIDYGADIHCCDQLGYTVFHKAAKKGLTDILDLLISKAADYKIKSGQGYSALHVAAHRHGNSSCVIKLIELGLPVNDKTNDGTTPLHLAIQSGDIECVTILLNNKANVESTDKRGETPLHWASRYNRIAIIDILLSRGAFINATSHDGLRPFFVAANIDTMDHLNKKGATINDKDFDGNTSLHRSIGRRNIILTNWLIKNGADYNSINKKGESCVHFAAMSGNKEIMTILLSIEGIDINHVDISKKTPLHWTTNYGYLHQTSQLLDHGAIISNNINEYEFKNRIPGLHDCIPRIRDEMDNRLKRSDFDTFIKRHIEYTKYTSSIYTTCWPLGNLTIARPPIGWSKAINLRDKYYFDEIFFHLHLHIANIYTKKTSKMSRSQSNYSSITELATNNNDTFRLLTILSTDQLILYLKPS